MSLTYAKVGGPPDDWQGLRIVDLGTGAVVHHVVEVNTEEGWLERFVVGSCGEVLVCSGEPRCPACQDNAPGGHVRTERIEGRFYIKRELGQ